jgi:hypothetical protein
MHPQQEEKDVFQKRSEVTVMDIAALSMSLNQINTSSEVGVAMLSKALDTQETMGAEMVKMMEQSVNPHIGANIDVSV